MRRRITRDKNHKDIVDELEKRGVQTIDLAASGSGICDLVTYFRGNVVFCEIKFGVRPELKKTQVGFLGTYRGPCGIARNINEAYDLATNPVRYALTVRQKDLLLAYHATMKEKAVHLPTILKLLAV